MVDFIAIKNYFDTYSTEALINASSARADISHLTLIFNDIAHYLDAEDKLATLGHSGKITKITYEPKEQNFRMAQSTWCQLSEPIKSQYARSLVKFIHLKYKEKCQLGTSFNTVARIVIYDPEINYVRQVTSRDKQTSFQYQPKHARDLFTLNNGLDSQPELQPKPSLIGSRLVHPSNLGLP